MTPLLGYCRKIAITLIDPDRPNFSMCDHLISSTIHQSEFFLIGIVFAA